MLSSTEKQHDLAPTILLHKILRFCTEVQKFWHFLNKCPLYDSPWSSSPQGLHVIIVHVFVFGQFMGTDLFLELPGSPRFTVRKNLYYTDGE